MRYDDAHKEATRERIVVAAGARFRRDGIAGTGLARLMADAGLTHGGFYAHFTSKEDLVRESLSWVLDRTRAELAEGAGRKGLEAIIRSYLSPVHRDHPDAGCALANLAAEVARHPEDTRGVLAEKAEALKGLIADHLPEAWTEEKKTARARAILSLMMGALQLSRLADSPEVSLAHLADAAAAARLLAEP
ncbi:MAG: TetR/AcrR family transcriptional regulator [Rhodospirillum sp.]|nr:TetR/AcrR family transcriptional regulator [Rhodospirillum sp.]MCF8491943.1 TetR/AcrR family transcriptional regulator [Rhodospirillum sp.]MCF8501091.1 TetR/AcrR family transcriptional regulator [Rhodospirillum sp.]